MRRGHENPLPRTDPPSPPSVRQPDYRMNDKLEAWDAASRKNRRIKELEEGLHDLLEQQLAGSERQFGLANDEIARLANASRDLHTRIKQMEEALREALNPPLILATDDATQVAGWFTGHIRRALTQGTETAEEK